MTLHLLLLFQIIIIPSKWILMQGEASFDDLSALVKLHPQVFCHRVSYIVELFYVIHIAMSNRVFLHLDNANGVDFFPTHEQRLRKIWNYIGIFVESMIHANLR